MLMATIFFESVDGDNLGWRQFLARNLKICEAIRQKQNLVLKPMTLNST